MWWASFLLIICGEWGAADGRPGRAAAIVSARSRSQTRYRVPAPQIVQLPPAAPGRAVLRPGPGPGLSPGRQARCARLAARRKSWPHPSGPILLAALARPGRWGGPFRSAIQGGQNFLPALPGGNMSYRSHPPGPPMIEKTPGCWLTLQPTFFLNHPGERARPPAEPPGRTRAYWLRVLPSGSYPQRGA